MARAGTAPRESGAALVRLVVRHRWLDVVRRERLGSRSAAPSEPSVRAAALDRLVVDDVLRRIRVEDAALLRLVEMEGVAITTLVDEHIAAEPAADPTQVRARLDKRVQRARMAFRSLWTSPR